MRFFGWAFLVAGVAIAQSPSPYRLRADLRYLASDLLEGRAPGTRGDVLAAEYLRARFASLGLKTSFQPVSLVGIETQATTRIGSLVWLTDVVGRAGNRQTENAFQFTDIVFAGHGIDAPEFKWDDYGDLVVRGKIVVLIAGEPESDDPGFFGGVTETAYADAEYKFAEATKRGALAALIIHTPETAGYSWDAIRRLWGGERILPALAVREVVTQQTGMQFEGWVTKAAAAKWLETDVDALIAEAGKQGFVARRLEKRMAGRIQTSLRSLSTRNVIAIAPGADLAKEAILFTAHLDHLGIAPKGPGDVIHNGAVDNATGLAAMLEIARLWTEVDPAPERTAIFVATAAEEAGAYGAQAYAAEPALPLAATQLAINLHSYLPLGRTRDFVFGNVTSAPLWPVIRQTVERLGIDIKNFPTDSSADAAALVNAGVTAFTLRPGLDYSSEPGLKSTQVIEHKATRDHQPGDEYQEDWDISGLEQVTRLGLEIGLSAANVPARAQ